MPLTIPPLRERGNDALLLAQHSLEHYRREFRQARARTNRRGPQALLAYHWPGNVRELQNAIERAAILCDANRITPADLQLPGTSTARPA